MWTPHAGDFPILHDRFRGFRNCDALTAFGAVDGDVPLFRFDVLGGLLSKIKHGAQSLSMRRAPTVPGSHATGYWAVDVCIDRSWISDGFLDRVHPARKRHQSIWLLAAARWTFQFGGREGGRALQARLFFRWRKLFEQVGPVASHNTAYLVIDGGGVVVAFVNLPAEHLQFVGTERAAV
jgi:hypothetical protein